MSYSFSCQAASKAEVIDQAADELDKVVTSQPAHAADRAQALAAVTAFVNLLRDDPAQDVAISVYGSVLGGELGLQSVGVNVSAYLVKKA